LSNYIEFWILPILAIYGTLIILNAKKKLSLSNVFVSAFCILTIPVSIVLYSISVVYLLAIGAIGIIAVVVTFPFVFIFLYLFFRINIFPTDKISPKPEENSPKEKRIIGARRLTICGFIGLAVYIVPFVMSMQMLLDSIVVNSWLLIPINIFYGIVFLLPIYLFAIFWIFGIPTILLVLSSIAVFLVYITMINGCIRASLCLGKSKKNKFFLVLASLFMGFNVILSIYFVIKSTRTLHKIKEEKKIISV